MTCAHCAETVEAMLNALPGVRAEVSLASGVARVQAAEHTALATLIGALAASGFEAAAHDGDGGGDVRAGLGGDGEGLHVLVLGSGAGAFAAAIRSAGEGARVTMVEEGILGGTCVNVGCVPSKIMIRAAHLAHLQSSHPFQGLGRATPVVDRAGLVA